MDFPVVSSHQEWSWHGFCTNANNFSSIFFHSLFIFRQRLYLRHSKLHLFFSYHLTSEVVGFFSKSVCENFFKRFERVLIDCLLHLLHFIFQYSFLNIPGLQQLRLWYVLSANCFNKQRTLPLENS